MDAIKKLLHITTYNKGTSKANHFRASESFEKICVGILGPQSHLNLSKKLRQNTRFAFANDGNDDDEDNDDVDAAAATVVAAAAAAAADDDDDAADDDDDAIAVVLYAI